MYRPPHDVFNQMHVSSHILRVSSPKSKQSSSRVKKIKGLKQKIRLKTTSCISFRLLLRVISNKEFMLSEKPSTSLPVTLVSAAVKMKPVIHQNTMKEPEKCRWTLRAATNTYTAASDVMLHTGHMTSELCGNIHRNQSKIHDIYLISISLLMRSDSWMIEARTSYGVLLRSLDVKCYYWDLLSLLLRFGTGKTASQRLAIKANMDNIKETVSVRT